MRICATTAVLGSAATLQATSRAWAVSGFGIRMNRPDEHLGMAAERGVGGTGVAPVSGAALG